MADQSMRFLIDANSDAAIAQIKKAVDAVFGAGNATLSVNKQAADSYRQVQAQAEALAGATAAAAERVRLAYDAQRSAIDPAYASARRYEQAVQSMSAAVEAQIIDQTEANRVLALAEQRYLGAGRAAVVMGSEADNVAAGTGRLQNQIQNAAFQIGDFAVQVAGGTGAMRAAAMQLPQFLNGFGVWGAVIGGAVAVLSALVPMLFSTGEKAEEAGKRVGEFTAALGEYSNYTKLAISDTEALKEKFGQFAEETRKNAQWLAQMKLGQAKTALGDDAAGLAQPLSEAVAKWQEMLKAAQTYSQMIKMGMSADNPAAQSQMGEVNRLRAEAEDAAKAMGLTALQADKLNSALKAMDGASSVREIRDAAQGGIDALRGMFEAGQDIPVPIYEVVNSLAKVRDEATQAVLASEPLASKFDTAATASVGLAEQLWEGVKAAVGLSDAAPKEGWLSGAINDAVTLGTLLWEAADAAIAARMKVAADLSAANPALAGPAGMPAGPTAEERRAARLAADQAAHDRLIASIGDGSQIGSSSGGGGGGSSTSSPLADLEQQGQQALAAMDLAVRQVNEKVRAGLISTAEGVDAVAEAKDKTANALAELIPQMEAIGTPEATKFASAWREAIGEMSDGLSAAGRKLSDQLTGNFKDAFASFISGAASGKDAFQSFAQSVLNDLAKIAAQRFAARFVSPIFDSLLGGMGFAKGGVPMPQAPDMAFAKGGVPLPPLRAYGNMIVDNPTRFALGGTRVGLMGEAGAEAIMPLTRGRDGKLGVSAQGGAGTTVNIINQSGGQVTQTHRNENGGTVVDVVIEAAKGAVVDDIARGGSVSDALAANFGLKRRGY